MAIQGRRGLALIIGAVLVASGMLQPTVAFAEETPPPVVPTVEPTDPTAEPTPADDPTPTPEPTSTEVPMPVPTEATPEPTATSTPAPDDVETVQYTGHFVELSEGEDDGTLPFLVPGFGLLRVDPSAVAGTVGTRSATLTFELPAGLVLPDDEQARFTTLAIHSGDTPLVAVSSGGRGQRATASVVTQTSNTAATHQIYAVLVSPNNGTKGSNQTSSRVAAMVQGSDTYWSGQSAGSIRFELAGVVPWYKTSYKCDVAGSFKMWAQAASRAASSFGFDYQPNSHIVLIFPSGIAASCGGLGLGTVGFSANDSGALWVIGSGSSEASSGYAAEKGVLSHELGHNLSLGHANWLNCPVATPYPGVNATGSGCSQREYGDLVDVMGYSTPGRSGGALSSPSAIRAGIWPDSAWTSAGAGTNSYTLVPASSDTGLKAVVVQDSDGVNYYVEFRNFSGEDDPYRASTFATPCGTSYCVSNAPGVRILRLYTEPSIYKPSSSIGLYGDESLLIGRTVGGVSRIDYRLNEFFQSRSGGDLKITVISIGSNSATVQIERGSRPVSTGSIFLNTTVYYDDSYRVGDTMTAFLSSAWNAEEVVYDWRRNGVTVQSGGSANYAITAADFDEEMQVVVTASSAGQTTPPAVYSEPFYPAAALTPYSGPGAASLAVSGDRLGATVTDWPSGTTFTYQWYRSTTATSTPSAISGATASTYLPASSDRAKFLRVRVTATVPGYSPKTARYSAASNYTLAATGALTPTGTPAVGNILSISDARTFTAPALGSVTANGSTYQWLRSGTAVSGQTGATYALTSADVGKTISVQVTTRANGTTPLTATSSATAKVVVGTMGGTRALPTVTVSATNLATAVPTEGAATVTPASPAAAIAYQWYRNGAAISGATKSTYQLVTADYNRAISVRVSYSKAGWTTVRLTSEPTIHSVLASPAIPVIDGPVCITCEDPLTAVDPTFTDGGGESVTPTLTYQWYRSGTAITGAVNQTYDLDTADKGKTITVRVTARVPGLLPWIATSAATPAIGTHLLEGSGTPVVGLDASTSAFATTLRVTDTGITGPSPTVSTYQWLRNGVAISDATKVTYKLTTADAGKSISVRVKTTKAAVGSTSWTPVVATSASANYTITGTTGPITGSGAYVVGTVLEPTFGTYAASIGDITGDVEQRWQWLRNGATISGATASSYTLAAADVGTKITVRVTTGLDVGGFLPLVQTQTWSPSTALVGKGTFTGASAPNVVAGSAAGRVAVSTPVMTPTPTFSYQWYRNGSAIKDAIKSTYTLTSSDANKTITVRVIAKRSGYATVTLPISSGYNPMMQAGGAVTIDGEAKLGLTLSAVAPDFSRVSPVQLLAPTLKYQWLRNGAAITGATAASYTLATADLGKKITVRVTASAPGVLPVTTPVSAQTATVGQGETDTGSLPSVTITKHPTTGVLTASMAGTLTPATPAPTLTYQWMRKPIGSSDPPVDIPGATKSTYAPTQADRGHYLTVEITTTRANFTNPVVVLAIPVAAQDYALRIVAGDLLLSESPQVGTPVGVLQPTYGVQWMLEEPPVTFAYQWFADTTAISGATAATFTPRAADLGKELSVRVTASSPGWIPLITTSNVAVVASAG